MSQWRNGLRRCVLRTMYNIPSLFELFIVPFEHPTYQSMHMVHIKHVLPLKHFDLGNYRNMYLHNARASTNMTLCTHINTYMRAHRSTMVHR